MTDGNGGIMKLTASAVPDWAVKRVVQEMRDTGVRIGSASLVLYSIGRLIGLHDDELRDFSMPKPGRKPGQRKVMTFDNFLGDIDQENQA